jgi:hypothetical protein
MDCAAGDPDDDNDTVLDADDSDPLNNLICSDTDNDTCDDCTSGEYNVTDDGWDCDSDGACDAGDEDDDNDGALDGEDSDDCNADVCSDDDGDTCDDCSDGTYGLDSDGPDNDEDGLCDAGDPDDDNDGCPDSIDDEQLNQQENSCVCPENLNDFDNVNIINDQSGCLYKYDLDVLSSFISINNLDYEFPLEMGPQTWVTGRLKIWVATYIPSGSNGITQKLNQLPENIGQLSELTTLYLEKHDLTELPKSCGSDISQLFDKYTLTKLDKSLKLSGNSVRSCFSRYKVVNSDS